MVQNETPKLKLTDMGLIPEEWDVEILDEFLDWRTYGFTCPMPTSSTGPYMITAKDLEGNGVNFEGARRTTKVAFNEKLTDKSRPKRNDILLSKDGTLGRVALVGDEELCINQSVALLRPNKRVLPKFLYYLLLAPYYQKRMDLDSDGSVLKHIYITRVNLMKVAVPQISEQQAIVEVLSDLDLKIELNDHMNKTLEAIGQAIFKRWFVDFEFPNKEGKPYKSSGGEMVYNEELDKEIPARWQVKPIDEIADFLNGLALQKFPARDGEAFLPVVKIRELRQGITESSDKANLDVPEGYIVNDGDVLFSWSGSLEVVIWGFGKGALNQHLFKVTSSKYPKWLFYYWIIEYLPQYRQIAADKATTMGHIQRHHLKSSLVAVPDDETVDRMDRVLAPVFNKIVLVKVEARTLSKIRDYLLPKLMSGKIRVPVPKENMENL